MARKKKIEPKTGTTPARPASPATAPEVPGGTPVSDGGEVVAIRREQPAIPQVTKPSDEHPAPEANDEGTLTEPEAPAAELSPGDQTADIEDANNGEAVDDIAAHEADTILAVQDALDRKHSQSPAKPGFKDRLKRILKSRRTWFVIVIIILALFAIPVTRYKLIGLVIKKPVTVTIIDSRTATPVSDTMVSIHGNSARTNANGVAIIKTQPGPGKVIAMKRYYRDGSKQISAGLFSSGTRTSLHLVATGRQVPITIINKITGKPLAGAQINALKTTAKTNKQGKALLVLPVTATTDKGTVALTDYNAAEVTITVTNSSVSANIFSLTPAGHVYFLSSSGGTVNVDKSNLDGSGEKTVLAGTSQEDTSGVSLLASRDWRYLVLKSRRDTAQPALYLIDTVTDKVTPFDTNNGNFNLIGWSGHDFMYDFVSNSVPQSQAGHEIIKSYDADHQQLNQLDQSQATSGSYEDFYNFSVLNNLLVYNTQWQSVGGADLSNENASIRGVQPNGQNKKDYQTFPSAGLSHVVSALYQPQAVYYDVYNSNSNQTTYYNFANQTVNSVGIDQSYFNKTYPTYLLSPSGNSTFWMAQTTLFIGDANAQHQRQLNGLSGYQPYGWFSDNYLLVTKAGSLYIVPATGLTSDQQPTKISAYYQPVTKYLNYGYGYGGL